MTISKDGGPYYAALALGGSIYSYGATEYGSNGSGTLLVTRPVNFHRWVRI